MQNSIQAGANKGINWHTLTFLVVLHLGAFTAPVFFSWKAVLIFILLTWVSGSLGIGMGYHRLLTHRGFQTPKWVEYLLTACGTLGLQGGAINWVATHRIHHSFTEQPNDPHSPRHGWWWSHVGWILRGTGQQHPESVLRRYAPDLMKDRVHVWLNRLYFLPVIASGLILFAFGGWPMLIWGVFLRVTVGLHVTWLVNSATHVWGSRRFETADDSTNSWWVALLTFGEGWHNNHHAFPRAARHGLKWYEVDVNWWGIRTLKLLGLAKSIKLISREQIDSSATYRLQKAA